MPHSTSSATPTLATGHLIAAPAGWWETYDPLVEAWEATLGLTSRNKAMAARIAAYILLDMPLLRRRAKPDPARPADSWQGLDSAELLGHPDLLRVAPHRRALTLRYVGEFLDYLGSRGAIPSEVWKHVREDYDESVERYRDAMLQAEVDFDEDRVPYRRAPKVGRNQPCPCGSGSKYKRCCGMN